MTSTNRSKSEFTIHNGLLSPTIVNKNKNTSVSMFANTTIHKSLLSKMDKAKRNIESDADLYIDKDHELLCYYYRKFLEIKNKLDIKNKKINFTYKQNVMINRSEQDTFLYKRKNNYTKLDFIDNTYTFNIKYNEYNKKFINKIQNHIDIENINDFLLEQNNFIENLNIREIYILKYYTYHGDLYINSYIDGTFSPNIIKEYGDGIIDSDNDLCYFFYQFLDYFTLNKYYNDIEVPINNDELFIEFLNNNYLNFNNDIYKFVFNLYITEMKQLFNKAPRTKTKMILYRGIFDNYIAKNSIKGYNITNHFTSSSLFSEIAFKYTKSKNRIILKIIVDKNLPLIFLEGLTLAKDDFEVLIPINATMYIDYALKKTNYYKNKNDICPDVQNSDVVNVSTIIYCNYK